MESIKRFEDIKAWQKARVLVREVYVVCEHDRLRRDWALHAQLCRAAVSAMSNIAEGFSRKSDKDFARFLDISRGSCLELQSLFYVISDLGIVDDAGFRRLYQLADEVIAMVGGLTSYLRKGRE